MLGRHQYQIFILNALNHRNGGVLKNTLRERVSDLGLDPDEVLTFLEPSETGRYDTHSPAAAAYFGGKSYDPGLNSAVDQLMADGVPIVPVVEHLKGYRSQIPARLHPVNGFEWSAADPQMEGIAALLLENLRLLRQRRKLFISYKRIESRHVAMQLYHELDKSSFQVFLDTHGVRQGALFQDELFHRMADCDLVVFLNTETVLESDWVKREVEQADAMGITVLQILWPNVTRDPRTSLFIPEQLEDSDFLHHGENGGELTPAALERLVAVTERARARALAGREKRMLGPLCTQAVARGLNPNVQRMRYVDLEKPAGEGTARIFLGLGVPDAVLFHDSEEMLEAPVPDTMRLLYDERNLTSRWRDHLSWLSAMAKVKTLEINQLGAWLDRVKRGAL